MKKYILIAFALFITIGCGPSVMGLKNSLPHATIIPIYDKEHKAYNTDHSFSSIFINAVNGKETPIEWRSRKRNIPLGRVTLDIEDDHSFSKYTFKASISFDAKQGQTYILTSKNIKRSNSYIIEGVVFKVIHNGRVIATATAEKVKKPPVQMEIPIILPVVM